MRAIRCLIWTVYNAAADLLESNLKAGRGEQDRVHRSRPPGQLTAELDAEARRAAQLMTSLGLRREDRVVMIMLDTVDFPAVFLGAILAGIVPIPLNTALSNETYSYMLADSRAKALFVSAPLLANLQPVLAGLPDLKNIVVVGGARSAGHDRLRKAQRRRSRRICRQSRPIRTNRHSGSIRPVRPARRKAPSTFTPARWRPRGFTRKTCSASARTMFACRRQSCSSPTDSAMRCRFRCRSARRRCSIPIARHRH